MTGRLSSERGTTIIEVLMAGVLMLVILSATLLLFDASADNHQRVERHNDAQDEARRHTDRLARELRNLASPMQLSSAAAGGPVQPLEGAVDLASDFDFVFRIVADARPAGSANATNVKRVRYCLDSTDPADGTVYAQEQTWTTAAPPAALPSTADCPGAGWDTEQVVAQHVVNRLGATPRPLFVFDSSDPSRIAHVRTDVFVDPEPARRPLETRLTTGVFLRNQNRLPKADFEVTANQATNEVILNGSLSEDPESMPLEYWWYVDGAPTSIGQGVVLNHAPADGVHTYRLVVKDPAGLAAEITKEVAA